MVRGRQKPCGVPCPISSKSRFAQGRPRSYDYRCRRRIPVTEDPASLGPIIRGCRSAEASRQSRPPLPSSSLRRSCEASSNRQRTRNYRPNPRLTFAPAALTSGWSSSSVAPSACADVPFRKRSNQVSGSGRNPFRLPPIQSAPFAGSRCSDALRARLKSLHGRIAHAASSITRGTPDTGPLACSGYPPITSLADFQPARASWSNGQSRFRLHLLLFRCHPRDAPKTSTLACRECARGKRGAQGETNPVL